MEGFDGCPDDAWQGAIEEADELVALVNSAVEVNSDQSCSPGFHKFKSIIHKYQEQSQLLDSLLDDLIQPLTHALRTEATSPAGISVARVKRICQFLNVIVTVRGYKTVVKFFPHEALDLERAMLVLQEVRGAAAAAPPSSDPEESLAVWEAQSIVLLWMSMLIMIPFDLSVLDSKATSSEQASRPYTALVATILDLCKEYLHHPGMVREMGAVLLGRLLTRPDMGAALAEFLDWAVPTVQSAGGPEAAFLVPGILHTQALIFKLGTRQRLLPHAARVWSQLPTLLGAEHVAGSMLARQLVAKLTCRVGTTFLEPRLAPWRYAASTASLDRTLAAGRPAGTAGIPVAANGAAAAAGREAECEAEEDEEEMEVEQEVEEVVGALLSGLKDRDTLVRWSAAKGVGRLTGCLPKALGDDITAAVMDMFRPSEGDAAWHGGCLALAELARRGLLLPARLPAIVPVLQHALQYDMRRGPCSIGAHVRDAAAYVCWAFARAYDPAALQGHVAVMAAALLTTACYDREVNCRRAAAAAFQESVGRLGNFPHGIEIMTVADYFTVGNVNMAYTHVAPQIAAYPEYRSHLPQHLLTAKLRHWEKPLRQLAARALAALVPSDPPSFSAGALDYLLPRCHDPVLEVRHGAVLGVAELLPALRDAGEQLGAERLAKVADLAPSLGQAGLFRGKGGELMREAACRLVQCVAAVQLPLSAEQHAAVMRVVEDGLKHPLQGIQLAAVEALRQYTRGYFSNPMCAEVLSAAALGYASRLHDPNTTHRRGWVQALGALPAPLLLTSRDTLIVALCDASLPEEAVEERDVQSRAYALASLQQVTQQLFCDSMDAPAAALLLTKVARCLQVALQDYTTDARGDVGSWVREAAMKALTGLVRLLAKHYPPSSSSNPEPSPPTAPSTAPGAPDTPPSSLADLAQQVGALVAEAVGQLAKQAVERIARVREAAVTCLQQLLADPCVCQAMPAREVVAAAVPAAAVEGGGEGVLSLHSVASLAGLLRVPQYQLPVLEGLAASIGCIDASLSKASSSALAHHLAQRALLPQLAAAFLSLWAHHGRSPRLATPLLKTAEIFLFRAGSAEEVMATGETFAAAALELTRAEVRQCSDVARVVVGASLICQLAGLQQLRAVQEPALQSAMALMVSKYPKVRRHTAEQLYMTLLAWDTELEGEGVEGEAEEGEGSLEERVEAASEVLLSTAWDGPMEEAKAARGRVAEALRVTLREPVKRAGGPGGAGKGRSADSLRQQQEQGTYQTLLDDAARGWWSGK